MKAFLSVFCHTFILKFTSYDIVIRGHSTLFSSSIISGSPNWLTKSHYFINIHHCFHSKENEHCTILYYICSEKFFGAFIDPILLHIAIHQGIVFVIVIVFSTFFIVILFLIRFSSSCVFIFYIVFSFPFCLLQMFVTCGNYLIEKKKGIFLGNLGHNILGP